MISPINSDFRNSLVCPAFLSAFCSLPPVTFNQHILAMTVFPVVGHPTLPPMRRLLVAARRPDIMVAFVTVIAVLPYISIPRRWATPFVHWRGGPDANHDLRKRCRRDQGKSEQQCQCDLLHENRVLQGLGTCELPRTFLMLRK